MIAIIDYDAENLRGVEKALSSLGETPVITRDRKTIFKAGKVILPGIGSLSGAIGKLKQYDLVDVVCGAVDQGVPFLGIRLGLQLLFASSEENHGAAGLDILPGKVFKIPEHPGLKIPHMGWNSLKIRPEAKLFHEIEGEAYVCFAHSYYLKTEDESAMAASTEYNTIIHASAERGNVFAYQFHPEKNGKVGLTIPENLTGL